MIEGSLIVFGVMLSCEFRSPLTHLYRLTDMVSRLGRSRLLLPAWRHSLEISDSFPAGVLHLRH